ncbi:MAG TPA: hypothetical protein EYP24_02025 [bacterium (Candidatus Stahlbacteria)]|nr:hypothetical protein [Candidatus Stahlbacteria bacterium]
MIILIFIFLTSGRIEKIQRIITERVTVEIGEGDQGFLRIWHKLESCYWEREKRHWIILDSLSLTHNPEKINHYLKEMVRIDSIYNAKIKSLEDSLKDYLKPGKIDKFIILRGRLGSRLKTLIHEIKSGED